MEKIKRHMTMAELDCYKEEKLNIKIDAEDLLQDIKYLMREFYFAAFSTKGKSLKVAFNNGQTFKLCVIEI